MRPYKGNLDVRIAVFDCLRETDVAWEAGSAGEQDQQLVILACADSFFRGHVVGRSIQQTRSLKHACGISEPYRVPVGFDLARGRPAGTRASIEVFKRGRIQKQCL